jgi:CHAP domain
MPEPEDDLVEIKEKIVPITREEAEAHPELCADPTKAGDGVLDDKTPDFEASEMKAVEDVILDEVGAGAAAGGAAAVSPPTAHQRRALMLALAQKGPTETPHQDPLGSNCNPYSRYFGFGCQFWCADFVSYCVDRTGNHDHKVPWGYPSAVRNITAWGQEHGKIHSRPQKGDIFTYKSGEHMGLVLSAQGSSFMTVEGNTSGPLGDFYVASHSRDASSGQYWFVRWNF